MIDFYVGHKEKWNQLKAGEDYRVEVVNLLNNMYRPFVYSGLGAR